MNDEGIEKLRYHSSDDVVSLRGPSGQTLELQSGGVKTLQWQPIDKRALDLELRAFIVDYGPVTAVPSRPPIVRWALEYGHGRNTYQAPVATPYSLGLGAQIFTENILPQRGLVMRLSARELKIRFFSRGLTDNTTPTWPVIKVSISLQPVQGSHVPVFPRQHYSESIPTGSIPLNVFPPEAQEYRLFDEQGQAYGGGLMSYFDLGGNLLAAPSVTLATCYNWQPIPVHAVAWGPPFPPAASVYAVTAEYR